ncbi:uncharacterized protein EI90DRAFT_3128665 [Cantharellus anzutake]|uniref:uncharacterized protein n=1 Tax=Cantharellus anzutake TaxID=1750568 RepID=UPI001903A180|nr:uncharacterized protein EI90DRAFT_3128665 [Cantharellus anzutake]KAF8325570.1 hypothetical protein EI90DRAFT_3128665 [Cantharellus anzutake]
MSDLDDDISGTIQEDIIEDRVINFDVDLGNMTKPIPIKIAGSWVLFQYHIAMAMEFEESELRLGYKLSTETKVAKC